MAEQRDAELDAAAPRSRLTVENPRIWLRTVELATGLTGCLYEPKVPGHDGSIFACGGGYWTPPPPPKPKTPEQARQDQVERVKREIASIKSVIDGLDRDIANWGGYITNAEEAKARQLERLREKKEELARVTGLSTLHVYVPEGAMEWLLHEVGHWVAATPEERVLPDYGYGQEEKGVGKAREWQAWAFEEVVLAPFGPSREFIPPKQRGGTAFAKGRFSTTFEPLPLPAEAIRHIERNILGLPFDIEEWRQLYGAWIEHERSQTDPSWARLQ